MNHFEGYSKRNSQRLYIILPKNNKKGNCTFHRANLIAYSKSKHSFFITVQGKDPVHGQLPGGGGAQGPGGVPARLVGDVLVDAVGQCPVGGTKGERVVSGTCGSHSCKRHMQTGKSEKY